MGAMDLFLLGILAASILMGFYRGFIMTMASMASYLAGWWAAIHYNDQVSAYLLSNEAFTQPLHQWLKEWLENRYAENPVGHLVEESLQESWFSLPLPAVAQNWLPQPEQATDLVQQTEAWMLETAAASLTQVVVSFMGFVLIFLVVKQVTYLAGMLLDGIFKLPLLNGLNRSGGLLAGFIRGVLMVWVFLVIATPFVAAAPEGVLANSLRQSLVLDYFQWLPFSL